MNYSKKSLSLELLDPQVRASREENTEKMGGTSAMRMLEGNIVDGYISEGGIL